MNTPITTLLTTSPIKKLTYTLTILCCISELARLIPLASHYMCLISIQQQILKTNLCRLSTINSFL
jgi:hypothetical protein